MQRGLILPQLNRPDFVDLPWGPYLLGGVNERWAGEEVEGMGEKESRGRIVDEMQMEI